MPESIKKVAHAIENSDQTLANINATADIANDIAGTEDEDKPLEGEPCNSLAEIEAIYPNAEVRVTRAQYSTLHIKRLVEERKELIIDPDFQRGSIWAKRQSSELIESILMGIPIPVMYLFEAKDGRKQVVDGRQRISTILDFLNDNLVLKDLKILRGFNNLKFSQLEAKLQGIFEDSQMYFYIIQPPTPERVKYDIFDRVNRGGTRLTNQEMRNALYRGKSTRLITALSKSEAFLKATGRGISPKRKKDDYVTLRSIAFYLLFMRSTDVADQNGERIEYKSDIDDFLAKMMVFINEKASDQIIADCKSMFTQAMQQSFETLGEDAFRFSAHQDDNGQSRKRPINMPLFEVLVYVFADPSSKINPSVTRRVVEHFKDTVDNNFNNNVDSSIQVMGRFNTARAIIEQIKHDTEH